jgi:hypothetical protein
MLTDKQKADYVRCDGARCPYCEAYVHGFESTDQDGRYVFNEMRCTECGREWRDVFKLHDIDERCPTCGEYLDDGPCLNCDATTEGGVVAPCPDPGARGGSVGTLRRMKIGRRVKRRVLSDAGAVFRGSVAYVRLPPDRTGFLPVVLHFWKQGSRWEFTGLGRYDLPDYAGMFPDWEVQVP